MSALTEVPVGPLPPSRFAEVLGEDYRELEPEVRLAQEELRDRVVWHVNSTARGGGVAEMLHSHLSYARGAGVDVRWIVIAGGAEAEFFTVTKRIHNNLHESPGDGGPLDSAAREVYERNLVESARELSQMVAEGDIVFLHDPQTAGLVPAVREAGAIVVWRCHVGIDRPGELARRAWDFLRPDVERADAWVFSRREFVWEGLDLARVWIVPPTIDAFSPKNQELEPDAVAAILEVIGLSESESDSVPMFRRQDGTPQRVNRPARIEQDETLPAEAQMVTQVSRWDRLKDPVGLVRLFGEHLGPSGARLVLAGPDVEAVDDDPEGAEVLAEVRAAREELEDSLRRRVHLISLPMDDLQENAAMVNALQRRADVIVQKSIAEGFGLTVAEAMWKARPVVASRVGGIQDQIVDGESGLLIDDPTDLAAFGAAIAGLLADPERAAAIGRAARERVAENFLAIGRMLQYFRNLEALIETGAPATSVA
jgi:trehalose synthase